MNWDDIERRRRIDSSIPSPPQVTTFDDARRVDIDKELWWAVYEHNHAQFYWLTTCRAELGDVEGLRQWWRLWWRETTRLMGATM